MARIKPAHWPFDLRLFAGILMLLAPPATFARVFSLRPGKSATLESPESFGAKRIYGGRFLVNGRPADLDLLAVPMSVAETARFFRESLADPVSWGETIGGTRSGRIQGGNPEKRFLITSAGDPKMSLVFLLAGTDAGPRGSTPSDYWPGELPVADPLQQPKLVVEHPEARFLFAAAVAPHADPVRLFDACRGRMVEAGWESQPVAESASSRQGDSCFALFVKKGRICWLEARAGADPRRVTLTFLIKSQ